MAEVRGSRDGIDRADMLIELDRPSDAMPLLLAALHRSPDDGDIMARIALAHFGSDAMDKALEWADRAVASDPEEEWYHRIRSACLRALDRTDEGLAAAREAVRLAPDEPPAWSSLVSSLLACNRLAEAGDAARRLVELDPDNPDARQRTAYVSLIRRRWRESEKLHRQALALDADSPASQCNLGMVLAQQGRQREALACFHRALTSDPTDPVYQQDFLNSLEFCLRLFHYSHWVLPGLLGLAAALCGAVWALVCWVSGSSAAAGVVAMPFAAAVFWWFARRPDAYYPMLTKRELGALAPDIRAYVLEHGAALRIWPAPTRMVGVAAPLTMGVLLVLTAAWPAARDAWLHDRNLTDIALILLANLVFGYLWILTAPVSERVPTAGEKRADLDDAARFAQSDPESPVALGGLVRAQTEVGALAEADRALDRLWHAAPESSAYHIAAGRTCLSRGRYRQAEWQFRQAMSLDGPNAEAERMLGLALRGQNAYPQAAVCFARAAEMAPGDIAASQAFTRQVSDVGGGTTGVILTAGLAAWFPLRSAGLSRASTAIIGAAGALTVSLLAQWVYRPLIMRRWCRTLPADQRALVVRHGRSQWLFDSSVDSLLLLWMYSTFALIGMLVDNT